MSMMSCFVCGQRMIAGVSPCPKCGKDPMQGCTVIPINQAARSQCQKLHGTSNGIKHTDKGIVPLEEKDPSQEYWTKIGKGKF